jgi:CxxC motif-containing protein
MKELTCIVCPNGCRLSVEKEGEGFAVSGNLCRRGEDFARNEMTNPMRTVTSTVKTAFAMPALHVRTSGEIPKGKIGELMRLLAGVTVARPAGVGDVVVKDALGLGVDIIATGECGGQGVGSRGED